MQLIILKNKYFVNIIFYPGYKASLLNSVVELRYNNVKFK